MAALPQSASGTKELTAPRDLDKTITSSLAQVMERTPGLLGIAVSNPYGLSVLKVTTKDAPKTEMEGVETLMASVFALCASKAEKLQFGKARSVVTFLDGMAVVQAALYPVILCLVGEEDANVGLMLDAVPQLQELLAPLQSKAEQLESAEE